jgi:two-component system phosphate regulon response regulator OmpR
MATLNESPHILIVDDDPKIRQMLSRYFEGEGFQISTAEDGSAMRKRMADTKVDLVLLDLVLPGEDGLQLAREIRSKSEVGIIMLTGRTDLVDT